LIDCSGERCWSRLGRDREVDHHDAVLLDDADQQNDADQGDQAEVVAESHQDHQARRHQPRESVDRIVSG